MFGWLRELFVALGFGARVYKNIESIEGSDVDKAIAAADAGAALADVAEKAAPKK